MIFKNLDELVRYIVNEPINLEYTDISFITDKNNVENDIKPTIVDDIKENFNIKINSLYDTPLVKGMFAEENILFVDSVEGNRDFCGSGKVQVFGREIMTNLCESNGTAYINLNIDIDGKVMENVQFKLKASDEKTRNKLYIRKEILND